LPKRRISPAALPSRDEIVAFIRESPGPVGKREIARAFRIRGADRAELGRLLKELAAEDVVKRGRGRRLRRREALPEVSMIEVSGTDADGELLGRPVVWHGEGAPPVVYLAPERRGTPALALGDRVLARLRPGPEGVYEARIIRVIAGRPREVLGVFARTPDGGQLRSTDRRHKSDFFVARDDVLGARAGELVRAEVLPDRRYGQPRAKVRERLGHADEPGTISLIAIHSHDIPVEFPADALAQASGARPCEPDARTDLRATPLVTIDGPDARDFDDAVWAEPDPGNRGGWHLLVAIADVAHYVRAGDPLDRCAHERGNSVYFPDRVVPMLPEALSAGLCSLKPGEDRACVAVHIWIDAEGKKLRHRFERGLMRSAARLTYEQVQAARDGSPDERTRPLLESVIAPLYGAFSALLGARARRGTLELDMPERRIVFAPDGWIESIVPEPRFDSHRLIEEFMIAANVAAAETLEALRQPCMYRVHDTPDMAKVEALREFLEGLGYRLARGQVIRARHFTALLRQAEEKGHGTLVSELILRAQAQAVYSPGNLGHFGLALRRYCHFTSPIRRYSDLLVHRGLISGLGFGHDGLGPSDAARFAEIGEHISATERRAAAAERDALDRYTVAFLEDRVGATFQGRINGVTRFGLFVTLDGTGADGLVPMRALAEDYYVHDEHRHALVGRRRGGVFTLGDAVEVRLAEADAVTGGLVFEIVAHAPAAPAGAPRGRARKVPRKASGARKKPAAKKPAATKTAAKKPAAPKPARAGARAAPARAGARAAARKGRRR
jgi:ribonuclease R